MAESTEHKKLVEQLVNKINGIVPKNSIIMVDSDKSPLPIFVYGGVCPDVYCRSGDFMFIGEAKTLRDVERKHSIYQYEKYIETVEAFEGIGFFILCVHWDAFLTAQRIIRRLLPKNRIGKYIVLSSNGREAEII